MQDQLINLIANELSVIKENINLDTDIHDDLGADSLDVVELVMSIEDTFNVSVPEGEISHLRTVRDLLRFIENNQ
jgi:acyl carrier protein